MYSIHKKPKELNLLQCVTSNKSISLLIKEILTPKRCNKFLHQAIRYTQYVSDGDKGPSVKQARS